MKSGKILLGVLAGVAVGATLGILFAPDKGSETRKKISKKGQDYAEDLEEKFNDLLAGFKEKFEEVKEEYADNFNVDDMRKGKGDEGRSSGTQTGESAGI